MYRSLSLILILIAGFLVIQCANQTMPTGGPKDETPPKLLSSTPTQEQLNYKSKTVTLLFDEDIRLDKAKQQILITPRIDQEYEIRQRKNRVILELDSALAQNTTYTINFRQSIVDLTEGNPAEQLKLAFSTGNYIDSLSVSGYVQNVVSGEPAKKAVVALYPAGDTTDILQGLPTYFTETSDSGDFVIDNIKTGDYRLYAFNDSNNNLKAESQKESYGFYPDTLSITSNIKDLRVGLISLDLRELKILSARQSGTTFDIKTNKYITDYTIQPFDTTVHFFSHFKDPEQHQIISLYNTFPITDSLGIYTSVTDSMQQTVKDTLYVKFGETRRKPDKLTSRFQTKTIPVTDPVLKSTVSFNKPIAFINRDSLYIRIDSTLNLSLDSTQFNWNEQRTQLDFKYTFDPKLFEQPETKEEEKKKSARSMPPALYAGKGAFISAERDSSEQNSASLTFATDKTLGALTLKITTSRKNAIIQLLTQDNTIVREVPASPSIEFKNLEPATYIVRAIIDRNGNGKWDPGNILKRELPEEIIYFTKRDGSKTNQLKANFYITENFTF